MYLVKTAWKIRIQMGSQCIVVLMAVRNEVFGTAMKITYSLIGFGSG